MAMALAVPYPAGPATASITAIDLSAATPARQVLRDTIAQHLIAAGNAGWWTNAIDAVVRLARSGEPFDTDDVWAILQIVEEQLPDGFVAPPADRRALGGVMRRCATDGIIRSAHRWVQSERSECHSRPVRVWRAGAYAHKGIPDADEKAA